MTDHRSPALRWILAFSLTALPLFADFSYEETSQLTGGALLGVMKFAGVFAPKGQKPTEPMQSSTAIRKNQMLRKTAQEATIIDLDKRTITTIHLAKKTYSVLTFDQMKEQMAQVSDKMKSDPQNGQASVQVKVSDTGKTRELSGVQAHETVLTISLSGADAKSGASGQMNVVSDMWISPDVPGYQEVNEFHKRMAQELNWMPGDNPLLARPDLAKGMSELYEQGSKLAGLPLETKTQMTAAGQPGAGTASEPQTGSAPQSDTNTQSNGQAAQNTSVTSALSSALGSRFGLGRHKKTDDSNAQNGNHNEESAAANGALIEMTTRITSTSANAVDSAIFDVPPGFKQVDEQLVNRRGR